MIVHPLSAPVNRVPDIQSDPGAAPKDDHRQRLADGAACLAAALGYLKRFGWPVLALCPPDHVGVSRVSRKHVKNCGSPGKRPWHTWKQYQDAPPIEAEVLDWWRLMPNSNVGMALGQLLRVDTDGPAGEERLAMLSGGDLPATLEFVGDTTKGGRGLLYLAPRGEALRTTNETPRPGEELRLQARGAQTVLPPSRHSRGMLYAWKAGHGPGEIEPALAPAWLVEALHADRPGMRRRRKEGAAGTVAAVGTIDPEAHPPEGKLAALLEADARFAQTWQRARPDLVDQSSTGYEMALASRASRAGWSGAEVLALLVAFRRTHGDQGKRSPKHAGYYALTIGKARATVAASPSRRLVIEL
jgi:hypothetical protein